MSQVNSVISVPRPGRDPIEVGNDRKLTLIAGPCQLESADHAQMIAGTLKEACAALGAGLIFKGSFDKANRTSLSGKRGAGLEAAMPIFADIRKEFDLPVITDVHTEEQCRIVADVVDVLQIPAFLCRQTDLLHAAASTGRPLHIKKMQMMAPRELHNVLEKCRALNSGPVWLCERGTLFGYHNLVVDPLAFAQLKQLGAPVTFDVTHALQQPGALGVSTGGRGEHVRSLARVGISQGIAAVFIETHPEPSKAKCDGACALPLNEMLEVLSELKQLDQLIKSWT